MSAVRRGRIDDIEILRACAVMLVIVEHMHFNLFAWNTPRLESFYNHFGGWTGVDLFFAISGFVIAKDLVPRLRNAGDHSSYFRATLIFWTRRIWRLLPSAWLWLLVILSCAAFFNRSGAWGNLSHNMDTVLYAFLQIANFHVASVFGERFSGAAFVYWSLSLEEQFYLLLPLLVFISGRKLPFVLCLIVLPQLFLQRETPLLALIRTDALFLGVLIALWSQQTSYGLFKPRFLERRWLPGLVLAAFIGILALLGSEGIFITEFRYGLVTCISALLVLAASYDQDYFVRARFLKKCFLWVGTRSYALYLIHLPSYFLTREIWFRIEPAGARFGTDYTLAFLLTALCILVVLSELNFRFVETPLRKRGVAIAEKMAAR